jgi:hypothetical protein
MQRAQRAIGDAFITAGSAMALVLTLVLFDDRVREQLSAVVDPHHPGAALASMSGRASEMAAILATAARQQSLAHAPLVIFAIAAAVLTIFMLRT